MKTLRYWFCIPVTLSLISLHGVCEIVQTSTCRLNTANPIEVIARTSTMFTCHISYSCYMNSSHSLAVFRNNRTETSCKVKTLSRRVNKTIVMLTCSNIMNNAGRQWQFTFGSQYGYNQFVANETFAIMLMPIRLKQLPNFEITLNEEQTRLMVTIPNCDQVTETISSLVFQCQNDDHKYQSIPANCTFVCLIKSGSVYNISVGRLCTLLYDGTQCINNSFIIDRRVATITVGKPCNGHRSYGIQLIKRTSTMFTVNISYNCLVSQSNQLAIFKDNMIVKECKSKLMYFPLIEHTNVIVTCDRIENNSGRHWNFVFGSISNHKSSIINESFIITLQPVPLKEMFNMSIAIDPNISIASIILYPCDQVLEMKYLSYRCGLDNSLKQPLPNNCRFQCPVKPGMTYDVAVIRSPIQKYDGTTNGVGIFETDILPYNFYTNPGRASNFRVEFNETNVTTALIYFSMPPGFFDYVHIICYASYRNCKTENSLLMSRIYHTCTKCDHIAIAPLIGGLHYTCWANTSRSGVSSIQYQVIDFNTSLIPVVYPPIWLHNISHMTLNVTAQSDFDSIETICKTKSHQKPTCLDISTTHNQCSATITLTLNRSFGCDYTCSFQTKTFGYADAHSTYFNISIAPPKPIIISSRWDARYIFIRWTINEPTFIDYFVIVVNNENITIHDIGSRSFQYTKNIRPNRLYNIRVELVSNQRISSDTIFNRTKQDAPEKPDTTDIDHKIMISGKDHNLTSTQYLIHIDESLFSNDNGELLNYLIYVRQNIHKTTEEPDLAVTYKDSTDLLGRDYLAVDIPIFTFINNNSSRPRNISIILGNEIICSNSRICNRPLQANTKYRLMVGGCTIVGCTYVLSKTFMTKPNSTIRNSRTIWLIIPSVIAFVILIIFVAKKLLAIHQRHSNRNPLHSNQTNALDLRSELAETRNSPSSSSQSF